MGRIEWGDRVTNWGDMTRLPEAVRNGDAEAPDILCGGTPCFTAGHMVLTDKGYVEIERLRVGDLVATHLGRFKPVLRVGAKLANVGVLKAVGQSAGITCTLEHPFYVASDLNRTTGVRGAYTRVVETGPMNWRAAEDCAGALWSSPVSFEDVGVRASPPQPHGLSRAETFRLIGWYLGDGWVRQWESGKKSIVLGLCEAKVRAFREAFPTLAQVAVSQRTVKKISIGCTDLCEWIVEHFGTGASGKTIPGWLMSDPDRAEVLRGYMATDGSAKPNGSVVINSVSETLCRGAAALGQTLGYVATVVKISNSPTTVIEGRVVNQQCYSSCTLHPMTTSRKSGVAHGLLLRKVQSFTPTGRDTVYNIEVAEDNTFILNGAIVHNCQGFSVAGLRGGLSDPRGQLTLSFVELANAIDDRRAACGQQPSIIFWENVPGVRSDSGNAFGHFLAALVGAENPIEPGPRPDDGRSSAHWTWKKEAGEHVPRWTSAGVVTGPRRTVAWRSSDAQYAGLAQRRERVFLVGSAREGFDPQVVLFEFDGVRRDSAPSREKREGVAGNAISSIERGSHWDCSGNPHPSLTQSHNAGGVGASNQELFSQRGAYLVPDRREPTGVNHHGFRMVAFGEYADDETASTMKSRDYKDATDLVLTPATACHSGIAAYNGRLPTLRAAGGDCGGSECLVMPFNTTQITSPENGSDPKWGDACFSLAAGNHPPAIAPSVALRGRDGGGTAELSGDLAGTLRASGGGGGADKPHVLAFSCKDYGNDCSEEIAPTMRAMNHSGSHANAGGQLPVVSQSMLIRRLMPVECERLQGFPDGWTDVPVGTRSAADGPRYKQLGNSWAIQCVSRIGARIASHVRELDARHSCEASPMERILKVYLGIQLNDE